MANHRFVFLFSITQCGARTEKQEDNLPEENNKVAVVIVVVVILN